MVNIFVAKLSPDTTGEDLRSLFEQFGAVETSKVIVDHETGNSRGFGFVEMPHEDEALQAIDSINDSDVDGYRVVAKQARPQGEYQAEKGDDHRGPGGYDRRERGFVPRDRGYDRGGGSGGYDRGGGGGYGNRDRGGYDRGGYDRGGGGGYGNRGGYDRGGGGNFRDRGGYDRGGGGNYRDRGGYDRGGGGYGNRDRFQPDHRRPNRDDEDLYRFEEFQRES